MRSIRHAACSCGQLQITAACEPRRVSMCHCLECQRRTGSVFGIAARFPRAQTSVSGDSRIYERVSDQGEGRTFHFCPECGTTVFWTTAASPELVAIAVGAFADPGFPAPSASFFETQRHHWLALPETIEHYRGSRS
jgi:hypothetical protein